MLLLRQHVPYPVCLYRCGRGVCDVHHNSDGKLDYAAGVAAPPSAPTAVLASSHLCGRHLPDFSPLQGKTAQQLLGYLCIERFLTLLPLLFWLAFTFVEGIFLTSVLYKVRVHYSRCAVCALEVPDLHRTHARHNGPHSSEHHVQ